MHCLSQDKLILFPVCFNALAKQRKHSWGWDPGGPCFPTFPHCVRMEEVQVTMRSLTVGQCLAHLQAIWGVAKALEHISWENWATESDSQGHKLNQNCEEMLEDWCKS
jgi:hypothetical protein